MHSRHSPDRRPIAAAAVLVCAALAGCAGGVESSGSASLGGMQCVDDSWECINKRQAALKTLMADKDRRWVKEPATPQGYASGVRLFAYRGKKKEMTCDELLAGRREADAAPGTLRGPGGAGLTPAQVSRSVMLAAEVGKELGNEYNRRCKKA